MHTIISLIVELYAPYLTFIGIVLLFIQLVKWAKKQKAAAFAFGILCQIFLPDPKAQQTIEIVDKVKKVDNEEQNQDLEKDTNLG